MFKVTAYAIASLTDTVFPETGRSDARQIVSRLQSEGWDIIVATNTANGMSYSWSPYKGWLTHYPELKAV